MGNQMRFKVNKIDFDELLRRLEGFPTMKQFTELDQKVDTKTDIITTEILKNKLEITD